MEFLDPIKEYEKTDPIDLVDFHEGVQSYVDIEYSKDKICIRAKEFIGVIPLNSQLSLIVNSRFPMENLLYIIFRANGYDHQIISTSTPKGPDTTKIMAQDYDSFMVFDFIVYGLLNHLKLLGTYGMLKEPRSKIYQDKIKGKILLKQTLNHWIRGRFDRIVCHHRELSRDNTPNQVIKLTLDVLQELGVHLLDEKIRHDFFIQKRLFDDIEVPRHLDLREIEYRMKRGRLPRNYEKYYEILPLCLMILNHVNINLDEFGTISVSPFVVDMRKVFEEYISEIVSDCFISDNLSVEIQSEIALFESESTRSIIPDILINNDVSRIVIDVKYKEEIKSADLYQIITYMYRTNSDLGILIYPKSTVNKDIVSHSFKDKSVIVYFFDLLYPKESEKKLKSQLLSHLKIAF
ncbi:MAG: hypothetical protein GF411_12930 [Candidatus Lokiarchaeota archaeon]|nr:hypothetical protein [Candidatus Lokiarchaeota archaeon]